MSFTVASALTWWACDTPDAVALSVDGDAIDFRDLHAWSLRIARRLQEDGVKPGDRVTMVAVNAMPYAALILALQAIGAIGAPLTFRSTAREIAEGVATFEPVLVFADAERREAVVEGLGGADRVRMLDTLLALRHGDPVTIDHTPDRDDPLFIISTSGSTGRPKGALHTQFGVMSYAAEFALMEPGCAKGSSILSVGPFSSASGYLLLLQFLAIGAATYMESKFDPARALALIERHRITTFLAVPIFFERIAALPEFAAADVSSLRFAQVAGARVSPALLDAWHAKGVVLRHAYGNTEGGGGWAARDDTALAEPHKAGRGGMFNRWAIAGVDGGLAPPDTPGEVLMRGASMMAGYWRDDAQTAEAICNGWFHTGDRGTMDARGNLTFLDRLKDIIISGGLNISAAEIERVIAAVPGVAEVAVIAVDDAAFGEVALAAIHGRADTAAIVAACDRELAAYKVPRYVVIEPEPLPRLPSGKIAKPALRERHRDAAARLRKVR